MNMKYKNVIIILFLLIFSILLFSCNKYKEILKDAELIKITVYIYDNDFIDHENYYIEIMEINKIKIISKYISNVSSPLYKCGYNGKIEFYCKNNNILLDVKFNTGCNTIVFEYDNKFYNRRISKDGIIYLENIMKNIEEKYNKEVVR